MNSGAFLINVFLKALVMGYLLESPGSMVQV